jgi:hypothetical protein
MDRDDEIARLSDKSMKDLDTMKKQEGLARDLGFAFSDAFESAVLSGDKLSDVLKRLEQDLLRVFMRSLVTKPLEGFLSNQVEGFMGGGSRAAGFLSGLMGGTGGVVMEKAGEGILKAATVLHSGGIVGNDNLPTRILPASVFLDAPRYHSGGMAGGLRGDEVPAVLQRGEMVLTQAQQLAVGTALKGRAVVINQTIKTDDPGAFNRSSSQVARAGARGIQRAARSA